MTQHLGHAWTVLKRNVLLPTSLLLHSHHPDDTNRNQPRTSPKNVCLFKTFERRKKKQKKKKFQKAGFDFFAGEKKGHRHFDCHTHLGQFYT